MNLQFINIKKLKANKEKLAILSTLIVATIELSSFITKFSWILSSTLACVLVYMRIRGTLSYERLKHSIFAVGLILASIWISYLQDRGESFAGRSKIIKRINRVISYSEMEIDKRINQLKRIDEVNHSDVKEFQKTNQDSVVFYGSSSIFAKQNTLEIFNFSVDRCKDSIAELLVAFVGDIENHQKKAGTFHDLDYRTSNILIGNKADLAIQILSKLPDQCKRLNWFHYAHPYIQSRKEVVSAVSETEINKALQKYTPILKKLDNKILVDIYRHKQSNNSQLIHSTKNIIQGRTIYIEDDQLKDCSELKRNFKGLLTSYLFYQYHYFDIASNVPGLVIYSKGISPSRLKTRQNPYVYELTELPKSSQGTICEGIFKNGEVLAGIKQIQI